MMSTHFLYRTVGAVGAIDMLHPSHSLKKPLVIAISMTTLALGQSSAFAKQPVLELPETVVTASRVATPLADIIGDVTVIDAEEIATHKGQTLADVLQGQAGLQLKKTGPMGQEAGIFLRGTDKNKTLVLIDGVRFATGGLAQANIQAIPADQIERVEILYGSAGTSLYGADAIGGVVQVFTKSSSAVNNVYATVGLGTQDTRVMGGGFTVGNKATRFGMNVSHRESDSISAKGSIAVGIENDNDPSKITSLTTSLSHRLNDYVQLGANGLASKSRTEYDQGVKNPGILSKKDIANLNVWSKIKATDKLALNLSYGVNLDQSADGAYLIDTKQEQAQLQLDYALPVGKTFFGAESLTQEILKGSFAKTTKRKTQSAFLGYQFSEKYLQGQLSARYDDMTDYKNEFTYAAGLAVEPIKGLRIGGSYATGFRQPSIGDLYAKSSTPNKSIKPEESKNAEIFFAVNAGSVSSRITGYQNKIDNLITYLPPTYAPKNTKKAKISGVTWKSEYDNGHYLAGFHYDYLDAKDATKNKQLAYRAKHKGGIFVGTSIDNKLNVRAEYDYVGKRFTDESNTDEVDSYNLVNLSATTKLNPNVDVSLRWNNIFGEGYEMTKGYNTLGPNALASVTIHNK